MNTKRDRWSQRYRVALEKHLLTGPGANLKPASRLGRQAVTLGLELADLAGIHDRAIIALPLFDSTRVLIQQAHGFFSETTSLVTAGEGVAQSDGNDTNPPKKAQIACALEMTGSCRQSPRDRLRGQPTEAALENQRLDSTQLLILDFPKQTELRRLTYGILQAQEGERQTISHQLQDEVVQNLLGIQVGLVNLRTSAKGDSANFIKEIASLQRLVKDSIDSINQLARELGNPNPAPNDQSLKAL